MWYPHTLYFVMEFNLYQMVQIIIRRIWDWLKQKELFLLMCVHTSWSVLCSVTWLYLQLGTDWAVAWAQVCFTGVHSRPRQRGSSNLIGMSSQGSGRGAREHAETWAASKARLRRGTLLSLPTFGQIKRVMWLTPPSGEVGRSIPALEEEVRE